jgi:hypothetical protein
MARRTHPNAHVRCLCGQLCPLALCSCSHATPGDQCHWCDWWDEHEPHDTPKYVLQIREIGDFLVDLNEETLNDFFDGM